MNVQEFKQILYSFADNKNDIEFEKDTFLATIRKKELIGQLKTISGNLFIIESGNEYPIREWVAIRLADLETLANRILENIPEEIDFIEPKGSFLDDTSLIDKEVEIESVAKYLLTELPSACVGSTKIIYLTSDAGEGKTTIINQIARKQASLILQDINMPLFLPIPLSGRPFLRFDDIIIASLVNKLRFRSFYYESFIELVKYGFIIPTFDGFEEMFMVGSTTEALSATGNLVSNLNSSGTLLFATRKAYFENKGFSSQAKLFDSINISSIVFSKVSIQRWDKNKFIEFAIRKSISDSESLYNLIVARLKNPEHPLITRPVLVNKLISVLSNDEDKELILEKLGNTKEYFPNFVDTIIEREANLKWIDTSGEPFKPLLSKIEHYDLLAFVAEEMWLNNVDEISEQVLETIVEIYSESKNISLQIIDQIKERIKQHALIVFSNSGQKLFRFDHEEFKNFFLGVSLSEKINRGDSNSLISILKRKKLPDISIDVMIEKVDRNANNIEELLTKIHQSISTESILSSIKENFANIAINLVNNVSFNKKLILENFYFPTNSLEEVSIENIFFKKCIFQETTLNRSKLNLCVLEKCSFERLEVNEDNVEINEVTMKETTVSCFFDLKNDVTIYSPSQIKLKLVKLGFNLDKMENIEDLESDKIDDNIILVEKVFRRFMRNTQVNENIFRLKLSNRFDYFKKNILPDLISLNIIEEIEYLGSGHQKRFRLSAKFDDIDQALKNCNGKYVDFLEYFKKEQ